jgi:predicted DsbA family dithiol-disulfide isomerase
LCREFDLQVRHSVFPLHPATPAAGMTLDELFAGRFDVAAAMNRLQKVAAELGLPFSMRTHTYNSRHAQELGKWAEQQNRGDAFLAAVYRAYFVAGENIASQEVLTGIAAGIGLDAREAERMITTGSHAGEVDADWQRVRELGIRAVPTMLYKGRRLVGFQSYEEFRRLVKGQSG